MKEFFLGDIVDIVDTLHATAPTVSRYTGYKMIRTSDIRNGFLNTETMRNVSKDTYDAWSVRTQLKIDDVILSREAPMGEVGIVSDTSVNYFLGQRTLRLSTLNENKLNQRFMYYLMQSDYVQKQLRLSDKTGSSVGNIRIPVLKEIKLPIPSLQDQNKIVEFLNQYDDAINLTRRINSKIQSTIKNIYQFWFMQFGMVTEEELIFNQELNLKIPKTWEVKKLIDLFTFEKGNEPGSDAYLQSQASDLVPFFRVKDIHGASELFVPHDDKLKFANPGDVLVTFDGSVGKVGTSISGAYSSGLQKITDYSGEISNAMIWAIFLDKRIIKTIEKYATGSVLKHASAAISELKIPYNDESISEFDKIISPLYDQYVLNNNSLNILMSQRNEYLQRLMNGQVMTS